MGEMDGLEASYLIRKNYPKTQILILTMHESEEYFLKALRMGAAGYIVKKAAPTELLHAVHSVASGDAFLYPGLAKALIKAYVLQTPDTSTPLERTEEQQKDLQVLTTREIEVLRLVADGYTNQEIANKLVISIKTVQAHRANVMEKLGLQNISQLVRFAIRQGLIPPEN